MDMSSNSTTSTCNSSMLWNWSTLNTCFLTEGWHVSSRATFAASCIGVAILAIAGEAARRACKDYDHQVHAQLNAPGALSAVNGLGWSSRRATPGQQLVRSVLHVVATGVNLLIMLVVMTFNGYAIVSVLIGTGIGKFFCDWMTIPHSEDGYSPCPEERGEGAAIEVSETKRDSVHMVHCH